MLQLLYISSARPLANVEQILATSRRNNARESITGLLYVDGVRFLQALEGPEEAVRATFDRIRNDQRHRAVVMLSERTIDAREFGDWAMAERTPGGEGDDILAKVEALTAQASATIRATFDGLVRLRRAA